MCYMKPQMLLVFIFYIMFHFFVCRLSFVGLRFANQSAPLHTVGPWAVNTYLGRQDIFCERCDPKGSDYNDYCLTAHDTVQFPNRHQQFDRTCCLCLPGHLPWWSELLAVNLFTKTNDVILSVK